MKKQTKRKILFYLFLTLASMIACLKMHQYASAFRYDSDAWGGELLLLLIPYMVWIAIKNFRDYRSTKWM